MILQKFCETTRHTMTGSVLIYHVFSLTLKIGHLASTNKMFLKVSKDTSRNTNFQCRVNDIFKLLSARRHFITNQTMKVNCQFPPIYTLYCMPISYYLRIWPPLPSRFDMKPISIKIQTLFFPESITPWMILMWCWWQLIRINIHQHQKRVHLMLCQFDNYSNGVFWIMRKWNNE